MPIGTPQGNLDIKNATLRTSNLETQNIKIGSIFVGTGVYSLEETANVGNSMSNTIQFTNTHTGFVTTSNVGIGTNTPLDTLHINGGTLFAGHIIPTTNATFDIGSAEKKVRDLYVDTNSLWVGDTTKIAFSGGKMKFKRRKVNQVPRMLVTLATSQSNELSTESEVQSDAVTFAQTIDASISTVSDLKLEHWRDYAKRFDTTKSVSDIFADNDDDYEAVTASEAFMEVGSNIFTEHSLSIGKTTDPTATLDIYKEDTTAAGSTVLSSITGVFSGSDATGGNINNRGLYINLDSSATGGTSSSNPGEEHRVWGIDVDIDVTGDSDDIKGGRFLVTSSMAANGSDQNTNIYGIDAQGQHKGSGPNTNLIGVNARSFKGSDSTGLTDTMIAVQGEYEINAGTCTDAYGVRARFDRNGGAVTNSYLFYGDHIGDTTTITNNYGLYVTGADRHYLEGNVGIGTTSPSKTLDIGFADYGYPGIRFTHTDPNGIDRLSSGYEGFFTGIEAVIERYADKNVRYSGSNVPEVTHRINLGYSDSYLNSNGFYPEFHEMHFEVMNKVNQGDSTATLDRIMTLRGNGNVGIGTTSPSAPLDVRGVDNPDMMAMFKTVSAAMRFHTGQGGTSNNWKDTNISLSGGSGGGAILFCFTMNNSSGDRSGAILYFIRKSHTADGTTNGDWNNDSSSVFKISGLDGGSSATSLDFQRNGNKLEYRTSNAGNGYFYAIEFD